MYQQKSSPLKSAQQGVVLIEALIAILIFSFAVLGITGLQATMVQNTAESKYRADASYIAQQQIGALWSYSGDLANAPILTTPPDVSNLLPNGQVNIIRLSPTNFEIKVTWQAPGDPLQHNFTTAASIAGG